MEIITKDYKNHENILCIIFSKKEEIDKNKYIKLN